MANILASITAGKSRIMTNFVPAEFSTPKKDFYPYALVLLCAACVSIFFLTTVLAYVKDYRALKSVNTRIERIKAETREVIETERKVSAANEKLRFLREFQYKKNAHIKVLAELSKLLPKTAWLTSISVDEQGKIEIEGVANRAADIISPIENSTLFQNVEFSSPVTVKGGTERFSLKMQIEEAKKEDK
jgi:general secretion pathway protein L